MIEDFNELSPDLEWMLQSNQVDNATLIDILVRDFYQPIFRYAMTCLSYPMEAHRVAQNTFYIAVSGERSYDEGKGVYDWLAGIAEEICQERKALLESHQVLNPRLIQSIRRRESPEILSAGQLEDAKKAIGAKVKSKNVSGVNRARFREILLLGGAFVVAFILIRYLDSAVSSFISPAESDQPGAVITSTSQAASDDVSPDPSPTLNPSPSSDDAFPPQAPLSMKSTHDDIWKRMLISRNLWNKMWADVWVILYGPSNYLGPPRAERHQIWLDQEKGGIHLGGPLDGKPDRVERISSTRTAPGPTSFYSVLGSQAPWFTISSEKILSTPYISQFYSIENLGYPPQGVWYTVIDELEWAGRRAVIVELTDFSGTLLARYWLDALTGLALKEQYPGILTQDNILLEIQVSKINFDVSFPFPLDQNTDEELFERGFAQDYTGLPEPRAFKPSISSFKAFSSRIAPPLSPPSIDFDPSQSELTFAVEEGSYPGQTVKLVHIFGDSNYLGNVELSDPFSTICTRSNDGRIIVLAEWPDSSTETSSIITGFDLDELVQKEYIIPEAYIIRMAYSPDNRLIAIAGISPNEDRSGLYIIDTFTDEIKLIPGLEDILSLSWNPDGSQLASLKWLTSRMYSQPNLDIGLLDVESGEATSYRIPANLPWIKPTVEIPIGNWVASFHLPYEGLEPCGTPPNPSPYIER